VRVCVRVRENTCVIGKDIEREDAHECVCVFACQRGCVCVCVNFGPSVSL